MIWRVALCKGIQTTVLGLTLHTQTKYDGVSSFVFVSLVIRSNVSEYACSVLGCYNNRGVHSNIMGRHVKIVHLIKQLYTVCWDVISWWSS